MKDDFEDYLTSEFNRTHAGLDDLVKAERRNLDIGDPGDYHEPTRTTSFTERKVSGMADQIINLCDFPAPNLEGRLALARREYPGQKVLYVGRPTALGNPYELFGKDKGDRAKRNASVEKYRGHLWRKIKAADQAFMDQLAKIDENTILACWCYPERCHSNVIWDVWHFLQRKDHSMP